ncbi:unnamed protein product [Kuraishia capsulata CBS 1993]|uniref:Stress response RCI peptide n=1 Tax=Kuraishia capsulata CBS 1993 TaxID=1382522 RepID=W6MIP3_9ASCO|nr:uncharacterized protein KUCA_T00002331001 [Kuraishia capsulata CBS 1993]CDK26359.1 unnamed protein product [Kuraishia capsulata CBS 1993]
MYCDCILVIISIIFPPLPVIIRSGLCSCDVLINLLLCLLGYFPGLIHSWYIISRRERFDEEEVIYQTHNHINNHYHYVTVSPQASPSLEPQQESAPQRNYGSVNPPTYETVVNETLK